MAEKHACAYEQTILEAGTSKCGLDSFFSGEKIGKLGGSGDQLWILAFHVQIVVWLSILEILVAPTQWLSIIYDTSLGFPA